MKIRIRHILAMAMIQDLLLLVSLLALAGPLPTARAWLIATGVSHHFLPESSRRELNQSQHTLGFEVTRGPWAFQASHMTDSFGCSSNEIAVARRWKLFGGREVSGGLMLGAMAAHRCTAFPVPTRTEIVPLYSGANIQTTTAAGTFVGCNVTGPPECTLYQITTIPASSGHWVSGLLPGAWLDAGRRVRLEFTLVQSPWTGHHWVAYAQLLIRLATFR